MPPKKKAKLSSSNVPEDPIEFVGHIRNESGKRFSTTKRSKGEHNSDIEQNVREVRALLKINAEIFGRCMESRVLVDDDEDSTDDEDWTSSDDSDDSCFLSVHEAVNRARYAKGLGLLTFKRSDFAEVTVRQCPTNAAVTELITVQERDQEAFSMKPLLELPAGLNDLFVVKYQAAPYHDFIDYDDFFKTAIMLHDDVLEPFLVKLKQHLESIQVCLGEIESWLLEPKSNIQFLEETFGKKLERVQLGRDQVLTTFRDSGRFERTFTIAHSSDQQKLKNFLVFMGN
jgi:hypothetical protein